MVPAWAIGLYLLNLISNNRIQNRFQRFSWNNITTKTLCEKIYPKSSHSPSFSNIQKIPRNNQIRTNDKKILRRKKKNKLYRWTKQTHLRNLLKERIKLDEKNFRSQMSKKKKKNSQEITKRRDAAIRKFPSKGTRMYSWIKRALAIRLEGTN